MPAKTDWKRISIEIAHALAIPVLIGALEREQRARIILSRRKP